MDTTIKRLARYVVGLTDQPLEAAAGHEAKRRIIDSLACAVAAFDEPFCQQLRKLSTHYPAAERGARIWGTSQTTTMEMAAFVNGTMLRYLDLSDTILSRSNGHPSDMIGALVAVAQSQGCSGQLLLQAVIASYEVYGSLCEGAAMAAKGLDQATAAAVGTTAGCALLLGLPFDQTAHALSLSLSAHLHLFNVRCGALSDWKGCAGPNGAKNGVFSALLAQAGITGPSAPVEGKGGLHTILGPFQWQPGEGPAQILSTHLKLHPVCYHGQSAVDAALALRTQVPWEQVRSIRITTYEAAFMIMGSDTQRWAPENRETADHSLPYAVATAWMQGELSLDAYEAPKLRAPDTLALMQRISVQTSAEMTAKFPHQAQVHIEVEDQQGRTLHHLQTNPKGHAKCPLSDQELEKKFRACVASRDSSTGAQLLQQLWQLDQLTSMQPWMDTLEHLLSGPVARAELRAA